MVLSSKERVALIHKGNMLFNQKNYLLAEKIFRTVKYQDGLVRTGQHYFKLKQYFKAADIFRFAGYMKGEYACYHKLGLIDDVPFDKDDSLKTSLDKQLNKKLAALVQVMLSQDDKDSEQA